MHLGILYLEYPSLDSSLPRHGPLWPFSRGPATGKCASALAGNVLVAPTSSTLQGEACSRKLQFYNCR